MEDWMMLALSTSQLPTWTHKAVCPSAVPLQWGCWDARYLHASIGMIQLGGSWWLRLASTMAGLGEIIFGMTEAWHQMGVFL